jgi:hypothetical protein
MEQDIKLADRLDEFCTEFGIAEKHRGSLKLLVGMAYVLGVELTMVVSPRREQSECPTEL